MTLIITGIAAAVFCWLYEALFGGGFDMLWKVVSMMNFSSVGLVVSGGTLTSKFLGSTDVEPVISYVGRIYPLFSYIAWGIVLLAISITAVNMILNPEWKESPAQTVMRLILVSAMLIAWPYLFTWLCKLLQAAFDAVVSLYPNFDSFIKTHGEIKGTNSWFDLNLLDTLFGNDGEFGTAGPVYGAILGFAFMYECIGASVTYVERYLSFIISAMTAPLAIAFSANKSSEGMIKEWITTMISQALAILASQWMLAVVISMVTDYTAGDHIADNAFTVARLILMMVILSMCRQSEQLLNQFGIRTMNNGDVGRSVIGGFGAMTAAWGTAKNFANSPLVRAGVEGATAKVGGMLGKGPNNAVDPSVPRMMGGAGKDAKKAYQNALTKGDYKTAGTLFGQNYAGTAADKKHGGAQTLGLSKDDKENKNIRDSVLKQAGIDKIKDPKARAQAEKDFWEGFKGAAAARDEAAQKAGDYVDSGGDTNKDFVPTSKEVSDAYDVNSVDGMEGFNANDEPAEPITFSDSRAIDENGNEIGSKEAAVKMNSDDGSSVLIGGSDVLGQTRSLDEFNGNPDYAAGDKVDAKFDAGGHNVQVPENKMRDEKEGRAADAEAAYMQKLSSYVANSNNCTLSSGEAAAMVSDTAIDKNGNVMIGEDGRAMHTTSSSKGSLGNAFIPDGQAHVYYNGDTKYMAIGGHNANTQAEETRYVQLNSDGNGGYNARILTEDENAVAAQHTGYNKNNVKDIGNGKSVVKVESAVDTHKRTVASARNADAELARYSNKNHKK